MIYLWTGWSHFYVKSTAELLAYQGPALISSFLLGRWFLPHARVPLLSSAIYFYLSARTFPTVVASLLRPFGAPFRVTPKGRGNIGKGGDPIAMWGLVVLIMLTVGGIIVGCNSTARSTSPTGLTIATCWALCNLVLFGLTLLAVAQQPRLRGEERFPIGRPGLLTGRGRARNCTVIDMSLSGVFVAGAEDLEVGDSIQFALDGIGPFPGTVIRKVAKNRAGIRFDNMTEANRDQLVVYLYTSDFTNEVQEMNPLQVLGRLLKGAFFAPSRSAQHPRAAEPSGQQLHRRPCGDCPTFRGHRGEAVVDENGTVPFAASPSGESATIAATAGMNSSGGAPEQRNAARQPQTNRQAPEPRPLVRTPK